MHSRLGLVVFSCRPRQSLDAW